MSGTARFPRVKVARNAPPAPRPIRIADHPEGRSDLRLPLYHDALSRPLEAPFVVVRGQHPGPTVGICAAVHGDELNGIKIIHRVLERANADEMHGSLVCAPVVNIPAFQAGQRRFPEDDRDLNHMFPGKAEGMPSSQYAHAFIATFLPACDYLIDIHTASQGRINSFYVRADLHSPEARELALLMDPEIILHGRSGDGTLRNAARVRGIPAITVEAGNPHVFQGRMALQGETGIFNILAKLNVIRGAEPVLGTPPVICKSSKWLRTRAGGLLETHFGLCDRIEKKQHLAEVRDPFGYEVQSYHAPGDGIVIGMSRSPVAVPGTRYCHLGAIGEPPPPARKGEGSGEREALGPRDAPKEAGEERQP